MVRKLHEGGGGGGGGGGGWGGWNTFQLDDGYERQYTFFFVILLLNLKVKLIDSWYKFLNIKGSFFLIYLVW